MFKIGGKYAPPPPNMPPPVKWGDEETVRERLRDGFTDLQLTRRKRRFNYPFPPAEVVEFFRAYFGPTQRAFESLDAGGQEALRSDLERLWSEHNRAIDNTTDVEGECLEVIATRKPL
jgi:hypothetical protein